MLKEIKCLWKQMIAKSVCQFINAPMKWLNWYLASLHMGDAAWCGPDLRHTSSPASNTVTAATEPHLCWSKSITRVLLVRTPRT